MIGFIKIGNVLSKSMSSIAACEPYYKNETRKAKITLSSRGADIRHACTLTKYAMLAVSCCCVQECSRRLWTGCT